jgi:hypothetical protein
MFAKKTKALKITRNAAQHINSSIKEYISDFKQKITAAFSSSGQYNIFFTNF